MDGSVFFCRVPWKLNDHTRLVTIKCTVASRVQCLITSTLSADTIFMSINGWNKRKFKVSEFLSTELTSRIL